MCGQRSRKPRRSGLTAPSYLLAQGCAEVEGLVQRHAAWAGAQGKDFVMTAGRALPYLDGRHPHGFGTGCLARPAFSNIWKLS